jgi:hydroxymethylpyrimidine/phosphomethylpyrimidine kinase
LTDARTNSAPRLLVLAGHDPSGGAGLHADLEACAFAGVGAALVTTAWTEQDGSRVSAVRERGPGIVLAEGLAIAAERVLGLKTGLLPSERSVRVVARLVRVLRAQGGAAVPVVVDPVLAASGGEEFLDATGRRMLLDELCPLGIVLTPNLDELAGLTTAPRAELALRLETRIEAARELLARGARAVVVKGGHGLEDPVVDLLVEATGVLQLPTHARHARRRLHGSGCRFATALAAHWGLRGDLPAAAGAASLWLGDLIASRGR